MKRFTLSLLLVLVSFIDVHSQKNKVGKDNSFNVENLRCEYLKDPLGIDILKPRLSWILKSDQQGQRQTAYQVLVASTLELLAKDKADIWDTDKVISDQSIHIEYMGKTLTSRQYCYWKVRVWDKAGKHSSWSKPAIWSMGLLSKSDWGEAKWIAYDDPSQPAPANRHYGYQSWIGKSEDDLKWVAIDLGKVRKVDAVKLYPARPYGGWNDSLSYYKNGWRPDKPYNSYGFRPGTIGFLFPVRFRIEVAQKADFSDARTVVDKTDTDIPNPGVGTPIYRFEPVLARYVRLMVTRLARRSKDYFGFALAEIQVLSGIQNVAEFGKVTALDSVSSGGWSKSKLVDGRLLGEMGLIDDPERPATMVRKEFNIQGQIRRAVVSVTGLGLYELYINGQRVGDHLMAPEWTHYCKRIQYQTYDVTNLIHNGPNAIGAQMIGGWWTGPLAIESPLENPQFCLLMRMDVDLEDGSTQTIVTDPSWLSTTDGPIRCAGIYFGERYDATKEMPDWNQPGFIASGWLPVKVLPNPDGAREAKLVAQCNEPIRVVKELQPVKISEPKPGIYVFDMGQNMAGWCRLKVNAPAGTRITLRHAEMLNEDGTIYTANLRGAAQVNEYIWRGGEAALEPHFTYHGFRYVEITGLPNRPARDALVGRVFHSGASDAGNFECSSDLINKIMHCVQWVQQGNMPGVPTDCPQRTERFGFLGDIQAFSQTAIFNMDMAGFFTKWMFDICDSQTDDGIFPNLAPHPASMDWLVYCNTEFAPGWSDAGVIIPWRMYENYADIRILQRYYEPAKRWVEFIYRYNPDFIWRNNHGQDCSDWLNGDMTNLKDYPRGISALPDDVFATLFFAYSTEIVSKMASVLRRTEDAAKYGKLFEEIKAAFNKEFVTSDGHIKGDTQGGYALALNFGLLEELTRPKSVSCLLEAIKKYNDHFSTGIHSSHRMLLELTRNDHHDEACRLINIRTAPSWGYMVDMGATTIWERIDGFIKGRGFQDPNMNSFNHMAFGSVGEWIWRVLVGINPDEANPGYKHFIIRPQPGAGLSWLKGSYESIYGTISCNWNFNDNLFQCNVTIPVNTSATIYLPAKDELSILESNREVADNKNLKILGKENGFVLLEVNSGNYSFTASFN
jgi:alpha-L-rhamnosidase